MIGMSRVIEWPRLVGGPGHGTVVDVGARRFGRITYGDISEELTRTTEHHYQETKYIINRETAVRVYVYSALTRQEREFAVRTELLENAMHTLGLGPL